MTPSQKLKMLLGTLAAPFVLAAYRVRRTRGLLSKAVKLDPSNMQGWRHQSALDRGDSVIVSQMAQAFRLAATLPPAQAAQVKRLAAKAEGQLLQDVVALLITGERSDGYFVEVGVGEGRRISNTYMLERDLGWTGLLVEPNRSSHGTIAANRTAILCPEAAFREDGQILTFDEHEDGEYSRLSDHTEAKAEGGVSQSYTVETITLNTLFERHNAPTEIDFVSIDTEGSEVAVLEGLDPQRWQVKVFAIEHNFEAEKLAAIKDWMRNAGYRRAFADHFEYDCIYVQADAWPDFLKA